MPNLVHCGWKMGSSTRDARVAVLGPKTRLGPKKERRNERGKKEDNKKRTSPVLRPHSSLRWSDSATHVFRVRKLEKKNLRDLGSARALPLTL